jgi:hypothetical protein
MTPARLVMALAAAALVACGGNGTGGGTGTVGVPPISLHDPPPPSTDPPGSSYQSPGSSQDPTGNGPPCAQCGEELLCVAQGAERSQSGTLYLRAYKGVCVVLTGSYPGVSSYDRFMSCDGTVKQLGNGQVEGTWSRLPGGQLEVCEIATGTLCVACTPVSRIDGGTDGAVIQPLPGAAIAD